MNLVGYVRVSTEEQAREGVSLGQQTERLKAYCALHGHVLVDGYSDEGVSASMPVAKRPGGRLMLEALKGKDVQGVVVVRLDRLFRDALDGLTFFRHADRTGATVHSISELIDSSTPAGKLSLTIQLAAAQYERDLAVQRATECSVSMRESGRVYGTVPYGCIAVGEGDARRLMRQPFTWGWRRTIVEDLAAGVSLRTLRAELLERGIPSPTGRRVWSLNTLRELRTHHASLASLPMADVDHVATISTAATEAGVSAHV
ncbi:recombinase family protein [Rhodanobacter glycinis]|uniref:recombinase family protein n=1 Tax=Rhodanobacter glycinis TaxID=582702 RepID=UPI001375A44B|nr:recombinase family protein [Rhodanobacter glycinis]